MNHIAAVVLGAAALFSMLTGTAASACGLDGVPSLVTEGQLDRVNTLPPLTAAELAVWTKFVVTRLYQAGQRLTLTEERTEVAASLTSVAMRRPWRWRFGDGTTLYGWTVKHAFAKPGKWRIQVDAYYPVDGKWYPFDSATISIVAAAKH
jgi:hypothetical protein